jgi:hypothetical protein
MFTLERLASDLRESGTVVVPAEDASGLRITAVHGRPIEPTIELAVTDADLIGHLEGNAADSAAMYPDVDPVTAAYRLFLVHLDAAILSKSMPGSRITLAAGHLRVDPERPADPMPDIDPDATYVWAGEPPGGRSGRRT